MQNAVLGESQAGIKIAGGNINNLRYADVTTLMAESEEELKSILLKVKESLKLNIQKAKIMTSYHFIQLDRGKMVPVTDSIFLDA